MDRPGEFDLIERIRRRAGTRADVLLGIGDDAALLQPPAGMQLAIAMDVLNAGVHFPVDTAPADIGWKALAVNLSDLAAMGASPAWCTLGLALPQGDAAFVDGLLDGFLALADAHRVALVGGDTTRGPLSVSVTAHGLLPPGSALRRGVARAGDSVWISGTPGDAAGALGALGLGLAVPHEHAPADALAALRARLDRPTPRVALGLALRGVAHACIDISDGLLADAAHVAAASGVAVEFDVDLWPTSPALAAAFDTDARRVLQAGGGDDYELLFTAPDGAEAAIEAAAARSGTPVTRVGRVRAGAGVAVRASDGRAWAAGRRGYTHFGEDA
ncbi:thiamine-phosphate kinase [Lysobacter humi (ex Lee et al. 2017)]